MTENEDYFTTRIGDVPEIDADTYRLEVTGLVQNPRNYTLDELYSLPQKDILLTIECIGNSKNGILISTANWTGFVLADLLDSLNASWKATEVRFYAADGYFASATMNEVKSKNVIGALYMNGVPIPPLHGFPLRIINPGYHGVKQPAWVTKIEVLNTPVQDYWEQLGWRVNQKMEVDSTIFKPEDNTWYKVGDTVTVSGAAFGGGRIAYVEVTGDKGNTWVNASLVRRTDLDNVWVFFQANLSFEEPGNYTVNARATAVSGATQEEDDPDRYDGKNDWPVKKVIVTG